MMMKGGLVVMAWKLRRKTFDNLPESVDMVDLQTDFSFLSGSMSNDNAGGHIDVRVVETVVERVSTFSDFKLPSFCRNCGGSVYWISPALTGWLCVRCCPSKSEKLESRRVTVGDIMSTKKLNVKKKCLTNGKKNCMKCEVKKEMGCNGCK